MIEVRRDLYMEEQSGEKNEEFNNIKNILYQIFMKINMNCLN